MYEYIPQENLVMAADAVQGLRDEIDRFDTLTPVDREAKKCLNAASDQIFFLINKLHECQEALAISEEATSALQQRLRLERSTSAIVNNNRAA